MTSRGAAIAALVDLIGAALPSARVARNDDAATAVPSAGAVIVRDGAIESDDPLLGGAPSFITHACDVEVYAKDDGGLDDMLAAIGAAIAADRHLGGAALFCDARLASLQQLAEDGAETLAAALLSVTIEYQAARPLD